MDIYVKKSYYSSSLVRQTPTFFNLNKYLNITLKFRNILRKKDWTCLFGWSQNGVFLPKLVSFTSYYKKTFKSFLSLWPPNLWKRNFWRSRKSENQRFDFLFNLTGRSRAFCFLRIALRETLTHLSGEVRQSKITQTNCRVWVQVLWWSWLLTFNLVNTIWLKNGLNTMAHLNYFSDNLLQKSILKLRLKRLLKP